MGFLDYFTSSKDAVTQAESRGVKLDFLQSFSTKPDSRPFIGEDPDFSIENARELYEEDPVVRAAVNKTVNKVLQSGYRLEAQNNKSGIKKLRRKMQDRSDTGLDYDKHLEEVVGNLVMYNNAFVEVIGNEPQYVNLLETEYMKVNTEKNGDVNFYFQDVPDDGDDEDDKGTDSFPTWDPEEVVHYKLQHYTTNQWSPLNLEAVYETVLIKDYIRKWLHWFFKTHQMRPHIKVASNHVLVVNNRRLNLLLKKTQHLLLRFRAAIAVNVKHVILLIHKNTYLDSSVLNSFTCTNRKRTVLYIYRGNTDSRHCRRKLWKICVNPVLTVSASLSYRVIYIRVYNVSKLYNYISYIRHLSVPLPRLEYDFVQMCQPLANTNTNYQCLHKKVTVPVSSLPSKPTHQ